MEPHSGHTPAVYTLLGGPLSRAGTVRGSRQRLMPLAWVGAVLGVPLPLPLPDLTPTTRGQEAAPQNSTRPGKTKKQEQKSRSRARSRARPWGEPRTSPPSAPEVRGSPQPPFLPPQNNDGPRRTNDRGSGVNPGPRRTRSSRKGVRGAALRAAYAPAAPCLPPGEACKHRGGTPGAPPARGRPPPEGGPRVPRTTHVPRRPRHPRKPATPRRHPGPAPISALRPAAVKST
jgi:hypothetical protein